MMAFFLLLWLLNATTEEQKMGISNYFDPTAISRSSRSGSGGVLGGTSVTVPGALKSASSPPMISTPAQTRPQAERTEANEPDSDDPDHIESKFGSQELESGSRYSEIGSGPEKGRGNSDQNADGDRTNRGQGQEPNVGQGPEVESGSGKTRQAQLDAKQLAEAMAERERQQFEIAEEQLRTAIESDPSLSGLN